MNELKISGRDNFRKNYYSGIMNGVFYNIAYAFIGGSTVLPMFINSLTNSRFFVGLVNTIETASWPLPQIFVAGFVEHKESKKPLYIYLAILRSLIILIISLFIILFSEAPRTGVLTIFILLFFAYSLSGGLAGISFMDIIGKVFPSDIRGSLWAWRMGIGGSLGVVAGFLVSYIIKRFNYPVNFGILFLIATFFMSMAFLSFSLIKEPVSNIVTRRRKKFAVFISDGIVTLKKDKKFFNLFLIRIFLGVNTMSIPFYIIFIKQNHGIELSTVGLFVSTQTFGAIISNLLWGNLSRNKGNHLVLRGTAAISILPPILILLSYIKHINLAYDLFIFFLLGVTIQGIWLGFPNALLDISPSEKIPTYVGFMNTMIAPVLFLPIIGGLLIDYVSYNVLFSLSLSASILAFFFSMKFSLKKDIIRKIY
ncbi:MFS transporter [candidate division WOR-3 bacterium]|nr:MFS transporter [candidate division WOR-3 bacterium]